MANSKYVLGMDIGGTNVRMGLIDDAYTLHRFTRVSTENVFTNDQPGKGLSSIINNYLQENDAKEDVTSISIGFPSTLDKERKTILSTPNIPILQNIPIVNLISEEIDLPIYINRDVNLLMFYDLHTQKIPTKGTTIGYYFGTGVGNAILINGEILNGRNGVAAELGHIPILNDTTRCNCGNIGCLENYSSGKYLVELAESEFPDTPINRVFAEHASHPKISQFIEYLAIAIAVEATIFDPEYIVLGGGVLQMPNFPKQFLEKRIRDRTRKPFPSENLRFIYSQQTQENGVIGAGIYAFQQMKGQKRNEDSNSK